MEQVTICEMRTYMNSTLDFYKGKKVLITGHTGFKGSWLTAILVEAGAEVTGYSLEPPTDPSLFAEAGLEKNINHIIGDVRDRDKIMKVFQEIRPEIVFHLAAQPLVRESYKNPVLTYETNVMGTVNICEAVRLTDSVKSFLNVTTDKVYKNEELNKGFKEDDPLDGYDPYSNSKSCSELVTHSYINSFFNEMGIAVSTARAGNVIGGGDFAKDRIIPDCVRAAEKKYTGESTEDIIVRNPYSIRPYQHVLEPLNIYLTIAKAQYEDKKYAGYYNVGPNDEDCVTTGDLVDIFCKCWNEAVDQEASDTENKRKISWINRSDNGPHEAGFLKLDCDRIKQVFGWKPVWNIDMAIQKVVEFSKRRIEEPDMVADEMKKEINEFFG
ncbi:MAG: CDP-glucose 4,6-dehydratase [Eubacterium sp.]|nr:CDP-glucose 4,6-dehydratase [Eubacterium sp.]